MNTSIPFNPFLFYSKQLQALLVKASKQKNPALWLYQNNARTPLFMLEALTRLHSKAFDESFLNKWHLRFKKLEDEFGLLDYYMAFENDFKTNKKIAPAVVANFSDNAESVSKKINKKLQDKGWLNGKLLRFNVKLSQYTIVLDDSYIDELKHAISLEIEKIKLFASKLNYTFTEMESEVHEMRRKLRWISIYAQALNGLIQLKPTSKKIKYSIPYNSKNILASPFNKLPIKPKGASIMYFDTDSFFALSWIINELGNLKDQGLSIKALSDALLIVDKTNALQANHKALGCLGFKKDKSAVILKQAADIVYTFLVKDKILDTLIVK